MAARDVFLDTSGLYALIDRNDPHHADARDVAVRFARLGRKLVVTDYVVGETLTLAKTRGGVHVALRALDLIETSAGIRLERIDPARFNAVTTFFRRHSDHAYSFTDCASFVIMRELAMRDALTTDRHFREAGFQPLLPVRERPGRVKRPRGPR